MRPFPSILRDLLLAALFIAAGGRLLSGSHALSQQRDWMMDAVSRQVEPGRTTEQDLRRMLGEPARKVLVKGSNGTGSSAPTGAKQEDSSPSGSSNPARIEILHYPAFIVARAISAAALASPLLAANQPPPDRMVCFEVTDGIVTARWVE